MGILYKKYNINFELIKIHNMPIISSIPVAEIIEILNFQNYQKINLGIELSSKLKDVDTQKRKDLVLTELDKLLKNSNSKHLLVTNIDILFNPSYKLNVLKYFITLARTKIVLVEWPGEIDGERLKYSETNHDDYVNYNINDYEIACIK